MKNTICLILFAVVWQSYSQEPAKNQESKYRRISLYTVMIDQPKLPYAAAIKTKFEASPVPDKFNDHNLPVRSYAESTTTASSSSQTRNQIPTRRGVGMMGNQEKPSDAGATPAASAAMSQKILDDIAKQLVAKWFNRSEKGGFNMTLIQERGNYNATALDIAIAKANKRGLAILADAGEDLINNTFVLVNDFRYATEASMMLTHYLVKTNSHLYRLVWNDEVAATFFNEMWATDNTITPELKRRFDESSIFKLVYVGSDKSWITVTEGNKMGSWTHEQLVQRAALKAMDAVIVNLQENHDEFKTKTPIFSSEPVTAKIGLKEGVSNKTKFDVLEQQMDENGMTKYVVVGSVKVDSAFPIWDNRYGAEEENPNQKVDRTHFKVLSGKDFSPGMLLKQKNGK
jgi:hypothetical protein